MDEIIKWKPEPAMTDLTELIEIAMASSFALGLLVGIAGMALFLEDQ